MKLTNIVIYPNKDSTHGIWYPTEINERREKVTIRVLSSLVTGDHRHPVLILLTVGDYPRGRGQLWPGYWKHDATEELVISTTVEARQAWAIIVAWQEAEGDRQVGVRVNREDQPSDAGA